MKRSSPRTWREAIPDGFVAYFHPLLKAAPLSKSAVSRVIATLNDGLEAWRTRSLADLDMIYVHLDAFALSIRSAGEVVSAPLLAVVAVLSDWRKHLLALELCGGESFAAWKNCLDSLVARGLQAPMLAVVAGNARLRRAVGEIWPRAAVQRYCVHKLRNLDRRVPRHVLAEIRMTSIVSCTPPVPTPLVTPTQPSSARGRSDARALSRVCVKAARSF
jgi:putative transposase